MVVMVTIKEVTVVVMVIKVDIMDNHNMEDTDKTMANMVETVVMTTLRTQEATTVVVVTTQMQTTVVQNKAVINGANRTLVDTGNLLGVTVGFNRTPVATGNSKASETQDLAVLVVTAKPKFKFN